MPQRIDLDDLLAKNPQVDANQLNESAKLTEELQNSGLSRRGYTLAPPFARRRAQIDDTPAEDPHSVCLHRF